MANCLNGKNHVNIKSMTEKEEKDQNMNSQEEIKQEETTQEKVESSEDNQENQEGKDSSAEVSWEDKFNEMNDKYLRLYSDFDNFRKRTMKEKVDLISSASSSVIKDLLPVVDDFERAIQSNENTEDVNGLKEGFSLIHHKFFNILKAKGLKEMESTGEKFDMDLHEAITNIPAPTEDQKGKVIDTVEKGYYLNEKVLRYAKVVVGQ